MVAKLQGDKSAAQSSMELYFPFLDPSAFPEFLARPSVIIKVSFFVWVFREHRGVPWEPPHVRVRK